MSIPVDALFVRRIAEDCLPVGRLSFCGCQLAVQKPTRRVKCEIGRHTTSHRLKQEVVTAHIILSYCIKYLRLTNSLQKMFMSKIDIIITKCQGHTDSYSSIVKNLRDNVQAFQVPSYKDNR